MFSKPSTNIYSINDISHVMYINLDTRPDRRIHIQKELQKLGFAAETIQRLPATRIAHRAAGCSISHIRCLLYAKEQNWDHVLIVEDDLTFTDMDKFKTQFNKALQTIPNWDVMLLAGNNAGPYQIISDCAVKISKCATTTGYLVKEAYFDKLLNNFRMGVNQLMSIPNSNNRFAIDVYWCQLQETDNWILVYPLYGTQCINYSDIEGKQTNYDRLMLILDKLYLPNKPLEKRYLPYNII